MTDQQEQMSHMLRRVIYHPAYDSFQSGLVHGTPSQDIYRMQLL